jgi:hypothetical protein
MRVQLVNHRPLIYSELACQKEVAGALRRVDHPVAQRAKEEAGCCVLL